MTVEPISQGGSNLDAYKHHLKAAQHCAAASIAHTEAAKYAQIGDSKSASLHAAVAQNHITQANEHNEMACHQTMASSVFASSPQSSFSSTSSSISKTASITETTTDAQSTSTDTTSTTSTTSIKPNDSSFRSNVN